MQIKESYYNLKLTPSYAVLYRRPKARRRNFPYQLTPSAMQLTDKQKEAQENLKNNKHKGFLSAKAVKRLKMSINWLVSASVPKRIKDLKRKRSIVFRLAFVTLTLPSEQGSELDNEIKKELLNPFLMVLKNRYNLNNYVWKAEAQANGNIHFHIIIDTYIPHDELRFLWNRLLIKKGYMKPYTDRFKNMSLLDYKAYSEKQGTSDFNVIKKRFIYGKTTNWCNPNTTDIHSVQQVNDLGAYLATYMSKKDTDRRGIQGRIWACSYKLSDKNKCVLELSSMDMHVAYDSLKESSSDVIFIDNNPDEKEDLIWIATLFIINHRKMLNIGIKWIKKAYISHLNMIRQNDRPFQLSIN